MCFTTIENVIVSGARLIESFIPVLLTFHLSSPSNLSHLIPDCNVFLSVTLCAQLFSFTSLWCDGPFPPFSFSISIPGFSFLFFNFCPFFLLLFITCPSNLPLCLLYPVTSPQHCSYFCTHLLLTPLSPSSTPPHCTTPCSPHSSSFASSTGWLSLRSSPWSLQRRCTTTSTLGPQTTSTFRQGNGSLINWQEGPV